MLAILARSVAACALAAALYGCATPAPVVLDDHDPYEHFNRSIFDFNETVDKAVLKPVAQGYAKVVPAPVSHSISNFFSNIDDVWVAVNQLLQLKPKRALEDVTRVVFNTTFGVLGLFDVSTSFGLPKHREDFGQTLGTWGLKSGPYLVLPFFGPSSVRDGAGFVVDWYGHPLAYVTPDKDRWALIILRYIDLRADLLPAERILDEAVLDRYVFLRESYLQSRQSLVHDGNPPDSALDDEALFSDEFFEGDPPLDENSAPTPETPAASE